MSADLGALFERLRLFRSSWISRGWSWDRRFECVASTFGLEDAMRARRLVSSLLTETWTSASLPSAPPLIVELAEATGGVRADQVLFATPNGPVIAYGLWWPWGGEASNISLRLGLVGRVSANDMATFREIFGALDG